MSKYQTAALAAFAKARELYTGKGSEGQSLGMTERYKSSNKLHLSPNSPALGFEALELRAWRGEEDPNYLNRHVKAIGLHQNEQIITKMEGSAIEKGMLLRLSRTQALNCHELSCIAAECAHRSLSKPRPAPIALLALSVPADHVFCVVGPREKMAKVDDGMRVRDFHKGVKLNDHLWAIDPWLNVCCNMRYYWDHVGKKLVEWQQMNKRLLWDGPAGLGWYSPSGDYAWEFGNATVQVRFE